MQRNQKVNLNKLQFDLENPRLFQNAKSQEEAFKKMIDLQKDKVFKLAEDIAQTNIINETFIVLKKENQYIVLDGNRRLAAIKLLTTKKDKLYKSFPEYINLIKKLPNRSFQDFDISCDLYNDKEKEDAFDHIEKRHQGELSGVGQVKWGSSEKSRFEKRRKKTPHIGYRILEKLSEQEENEELISSLKDQVTTIQRIFEALWVKKNIFNLKKGQEIDINNPINFSKILEMLIFFRSQNATVSDVYHVADIEKFFEVIKPVYESNSINDENPINIPPKNNIEVQKEKKDIEIDSIEPNKHELISTPINTNKGEIINSPQDDTSLKNNKNINARKPETFKYLNSAYPPNKNFKQNQKINQTFRELSKIKYKDFPISSIFLIRSLLETYTHVYIEEFGYKREKNDPLFIKGLPKYISNKPLNDILRDYIVPHLNNKIKCPEISQKIEIVTSKQNENIPITQVLNYYIHTNQVPPSHEVVLNAWKDISIIINKLDEILSKEAGQ